MHYLLLLVCLLFSVEGFTSKEGLLITSSFQIESNGIGSSGTVVVSGQRNQNGAFEKIVVKAFGKELAISKENLEKIPRNTNGLQMSYESGYEKLGGKTVYLIFLSGFTSGNKEKIILSVNEQGNSQIVKSP